MIRFKARIPRIDARAATSSIIKRHMLLAEQSARIYIRNQTSRIRSGRSSKGGPQRRILDSTRRAKIRAGFQGVPLVRTGELSTASKWRVQRDRRRRNTFIALPPEGRAVAFLVARRRGFSLGIADEDLVAIKAERRRVLSDWSMRRFMRFETAGARR